MTRSLPEKTFEHWCSIHLSYRYRAKLRMWWPTHGADIQISGPTVLLGKRFWLELKTTEWDNNAGRHLLQVDLAQLDKYGRQAVPDYYVFAIPVWTGVLGDTLSAPWLGALDRSDLGYQSHSSTRWFAEWTWVVRGSHLRRILSTQIARYHGGHRKSKQATIARTDGTTLTRARGVADLEELPWRAFWEKMQTCGDDQWTSQFVLPSSTPTGGTASTQVGSHGAGSAQGNAPGAMTRQRLKKLLAGLDEDAEPAVDAADVYSPGERGSNEYMLTPEDEALRVAGFEWEDEPSRGLISMTPAALTL